MVVAAAAVVGAVAEAVAAAVRVVEEDAVGGANVVVIVVVMARRLTDPGYGVIALWSRAWSSHQRKAELEVFSSKAIGHLHRGPKPLLLGPEDLSLLHDQVIAIHDTLPDLTLRHAKTRALNQSRPKTVEGAETTKHTLQGP